MLEVSAASISVGGFSLVDISFTVADGEYAVLMGRSGSGKTMLLEAICGLRRLRSGRIRLHGKDVTHASPAVRHIGYVPQDRALFSTMTVREQLAFSLVLRQIKAADIERRVDELCDVLQIRHLLGRLPAGLSGGEAQRVAIGRAIAHRPAVLCLDEPLTALDEDMREEILSVLKRVHQHTGATVLHVTHASDEARRLAGRILSLHDGMVRQQSASILP